MEITKKLLKLITFLILILFINKITIIGGFSLICLPFQKCKSDAQRELRYSFENIMESGKNMTFGILGSLPSLLPKTNDIFDGGKQALLGYPFAAAFKFLNMFCSMALSSDAITPKYTPDIKKLKFQFRTPCQRHFVPLLSATNLLKLPGFDVKNNIVIFVTGWTTNSNESLNINVLRKAYHCRGGTNFVVLDSAIFVDTLYSWSALNTEVIGNYLGEGLKMLAEKFPVEKIHLIGHSLGAHIAGAAGRYFTQLTKKTITRITGLDPANPCFNEGESLSGLLRGDAKFVDVIHSSSGSLGKRDPIGDADFYPGGVVPLQPGCLNLDCAHDRAWEYYAESVYPGNERNFMATRCSSLTKLSQGTCRSKSVPMGYAVPNNLKGNFFLNVKSKSPFGEYSDEIRTDSLEMNCGVC